MFGKPANYGTKGVAKASNLPPAEHAGYIWHTPYQDSMWFLGGENGSEASGMRSDLWSYNLTDSRWAWEAGSTLYNTKGEHGTVGRSSVHNTPGARYAGLSWVAGAKLWMFGGYGQYPRSHPLPLTTQKCGVKFVFTCSPGTTCT